MRDRISTLDDLESELDKDPEHRRAYRRLQPYHDVLRAILRRRKELGMTQKELAERAGTHQSRISKIENAEYDIQFSTLVDIAEALGVRVEVSLVPVAEYEAAQAYEAPEKPAWQTFLDIKAPAESETPASYAPTRAESKKVPIGA
jgi:transcriptional regulator with XRE-family HTH domain